MSFGFLGGHTGARQQRSSPTKCSLQCAPRCGSGFHRRRKVLASSSMCSWLWTAAGAWTCWHSFWQRIASTRAPTPAKTRRVENPHPHRPPFPPSTLFSPSAAVFQAALTRQRLKRVQPHAIEKERPLRSLRLRLIPVPTVPCAFGPMQPPAPGWT